MYNIIDRTDGTILGYVTSLNAAKAYVRRDGGNVGYRKAD